MARLALAVEEATQLGPDRVSFRVAHRAGQLAHRVFGEHVAVYNRSSDMVMFVGSGRVLRLEFEAPGFETMLLGDYQSFAVPVFSSDASEARDPGVRRSLSLSDERFEEILRLAALADINAQVLAEAQAVFAQDRKDGLDAYLKVHDRVLQRWRYRCVLTGAQFEPAATRPHPWRGD